MITILSMEVLQMGDDCRRQEGFSGSWTSKYPEDGFFLVDPALVKGFLFDPVATSF